MGDGFSFGEIENIRIAWNEELPEYDSATCVSERENMGLTGGAVAGVVIGVLAFVALIAVLICCCRKKKEEAPPQEYQPEQPEA
jgi:hypothetical protein